MSVEAKVIQLIHEKLSGVGIEEIIPEASLMEDLGADSLTLVEMIMTMEDKFDIEIDDEEAEKIVSVQDAIDFIKSRL